jgi:catechol 2,3-dioxygenase-like lactoylglutathione lyase family enzyme
MRLEFSPHVAFQVKDYQNAIRFYTEVMGMKLVQANEREAELSCGPIMFYAEASEGKTTFFEFKTDDLSKAKIEFLAAGCRLEPETTPEGHESCYVYDPYGMVFHLFEEYCIDAPSGI